MSLWCHHPNQTTPRRDERGEYRRCLDCGVRIAWAWGDRLLLRPPHQTQPPSWKTFYRSLAIEKKVAVGRF